jgi:hypothetical protein
MRQIPLEQKEAYGLHPALILYKGKTNTRRDHNFSYVQTIRFLMTYIYDISPSLLLCRSALISKSFSLRLISCSRTLSCSS